MLLLAPTIWLYYCEQGCAAYAAQPQLTLAASLTRKLSCYKNRSMVALTHHQLRVADSPQNIFSTFCMRRLSKAGSAVAQSLGRPPLFPRKPRYLSESEQEKICCWALARWQ